MSKAKWKPTDKLDATGATVAARPLERGVLVTVDTADQSPGTPIPAGGERMVSFTMHAGPWRPETLSVSSEHAHKFKLWHNLNEGPCI